MLQTNTVCLIKTRTGSLSPGSETGDILSFWEKGCHYIWHEMKPWFELVHVSLDDECTCENVVPHGAITKVTNNGDAEFMSQPKQGATIML